MKLLMLVYSGPSPQRIVSLLESHDSPGYTIFDGARGVGSTGRIEGSRAWPGSVTMFVTAVPDANVLALREALKEYRSVAVDGEHLHVATLPIEHYF